VQYLFNLAVDPREEHNQAGVAGYEQITVGLLERLLAHRIRPWLERTGRNFNRACGGMFAAMGVALPLTR